MVHLTGGNKNESNIENNSLFFRVFLVSPIPYGKLSFSPRYLNAEDFLDAVESIV